MANLIPVSYTHLNTLYHNIAKRWPMEPTVDPNGYPFALVRPTLYGGDNNSQTDWLYQQFQIVLEPIKNWVIFGEINYKVIDAFSHTDNLKLTQMNVAGEPYLGDNGKTSSVTAVSYTHLGNFGYWWYRICFGSTRYSKKRFRCVYHSDG